MIRRLTAEHWISASLVLTLIYSYAASPSNEKLIQIIVAPVVAVVLDAVIFRFKDKILKKRSFLGSQSTGRMDSSKALQKWEFPWLGLITGLIIAALLAPQNALLALGIPAIAIVLKHAIKYRGRNVFNPAALGLMIATFFGFVSWWAVSAIVIPFGIIAVCKVRRYYNAAAFLIVYFILLALRGVQVMLLDYTILFFALIMLIEPVTTPIKKMSQIIFGIATAVLGTIFALYTSLDFLIVPLLIMNVAAYWMKK